MTTGRTRLDRRRAVLAGVAFCVAAPARASTYPARPIRLVVPFPAGSSTDVIARVLGEQVAARLGQPIVVDNKPGADGAIAADAVRTAAPDGHTLLLATSSAMSGVPALRRVPPYDPVHQFRPVIDIGRYTFLLFVNASVPAASVKDFVAYARSQAGKLSYGYGNVTGQLAFASVAKVQGLDLTPVPYKGEPPAINDLVGGLVTAVVATAGIGMPHVQTGRLRVLATILPQRSPALPAVPTFAESGFPDVSVMPWVGLFGPAGMPDAIVSILNAEFGRAMARSDVQQKMEKLNFVLTPSTPEALGNLVRSQLVAYRDAARAAGIQPE